MKIRSDVVSMLLGLGLVLLFLGERVVEPGTARNVTSALGLLLSVAAFGLRLWRTRAADEQRKGVESTLLGLQAIVLSALAVYAAQSGWMTQVGGELLSATSPRLAGALSALWPALLLTALLPLLLVEMAYRAMARAPQVEKGRIQDALYSGVGLAWVAVFSFAALYVATERDVKWDLSYFRTARPGEVTKKAVTGLEDTLEVAVFFPPANEVSEQVQTFFKELLGLSPYLKLEAYDKDLNPAEAKARGVTSNGTVVLSRGERRETLLLGQELEKSRSQLRNLDQEVQKRLFSLIKSRKTVYLTRGHGERTKDKTLATDTRTHIALLYEALKAQNYDLRELSAAEGLANEIPKDAAAVLVIGPTSAFQDSEVSALSRYFETGGRLMVALDPEAGLPMDALLAAFGVKFTPEILANDRAHGRKSNQLSDRTLIGTNTYSSHPAVSTNSRMQYPLFFMGAGHFEALPKMPPGVSMDFAVRSLPTTWNDVNGDFQPTPPLETRESYGLVAASSRQAQKEEGEGRALLLGDSDALADEVLQASPGNVYLAVDALKWLLGDEALAGTTQIERDVPIQRTRSQDVFFFYSTIFLAPAGVLGAGFWASRRRKGGKS